MFAGDKSEAYVEGDPVRPANAYGRSKQAGERAVAFALRTFESNIEFDAELSLGADDALQVWMNGEMVHEDRTLRWLRPGEIVIPVRIRKGRNTLLARIENGAGDWGLHARLRRTREEAIHCGRELHLLRHAPELRGELADAFSLLADALMRRSRYDDGKAVSQMVMRVFPDRPWVQVHTALRLMDHALAGNRDPQTAVWAVHWLERFAERRSAPDLAHLLAQGRALAVKGMQAGVLLPGADHTSDGVMAHDVRPMVRMSVSVSPRCARAYPGANTCWVWPGGQWFI